MEFPIFVKYSNNKNFFKITSPESFTELTIYSNAYSVFNFKAKTFVDRNLIADLIALKQGVEQSSEKEFEQKLISLKDAGAKEMR